MGIVAGFALIVVLAGFEFLVWDMEWLWHKSEPKRDPRNTRPPF